MDILLTDSRFLGFRLLELCHTLQNGMKFQSHASLALALVVTLLACALPISVSATGSPEAKALFKKPTRDYSTGPLWVWNDMLTEQEIRDTLRDLANQHVKQVWVHPRPGLMTPYLSDDWFRLWGVALDEAEHLDMNVWIYDENSYPSGFAGGWVPELMPEARGRGLSVTESKTVPRWGNDTVGVYHLDGAAVENVSEKAKSGESLPEGSYMVASEVRSKNSPWEGNRCYVNLLSPGVTEKFLEVTMESYRRHIGGQFGKRVPGVFTDEPNIKPANALPWSEVLADVFKKRWGYDLLDHLPSLSRPVGDWQRVRHNYYQVLNDEFVERWGKVYYQYCQSNKLEFTGHYWDHEWPDCTGVPDNMAMYAWHQRPAIDTLMNQYSEHTHAQFGNARMCRELQSVANQLGRKRTLCEIYGAGGWDLRFEDMKRIGDWLEVLGINTLNQHLSYVTIRGARKRDHPQSFSYHEPWWEAYHLSADYFARLSAALSQGAQINRVLVIEPTTSAWMYQGDDAKLAPLGDSFFKLLMSLEAAQVEYDIGSEDLLARWGSVVPASEVPVRISAGPVSINFHRGAELKVGARSYSTVVLPPACDNLNARTVEFLEQLLTSKPAGQVISTMQGTPRVDGSLSSRVANLTNNPSWRPLRAEELPSVLANTPYSANPGITRKPGDKGILFHHRRILDDGELLFLVNTSIEHPSAGQIQSPLAGVEQWNPYTGAVEPYPFNAEDQGLTTEFNLPPSGSLLLFFSKASRKAPPVVVQSVQTIEPEAKPEIHRASPNVLTIDYVDVTAGGETRTNLYYYPANQFTWKQNGMERNPWDSAVQFKDELISHKFPADSGFTAYYKFTIEKQVPPDLTFVLERPDLYSITCNDKPVLATPGEWWLDKAFGRIPIASTAQTGENVLRIKASPFTMFHELEPGYLLGAFAANPAAKGFVVAPEEPLELGALGNVVTHISDPASTMWSTVGIGFKKEPQGDFAADRAPFLIFDLGRSAELSALRIWNYNEFQSKDMTHRGVSLMRVSGSATDDTNSFSIDLGTLKLARAHGGNALPELLLLKTPSVRYIKFDILANHNGVTYPAAGDPPDNGFVGLAEVQFLAGDEQVPDVKVIRASSQLVSHRRFPTHLTDGSGLMRLNSGWNAQGLPFYSGGVVYRERFQIDKPRGTYSLQLPSWYGSVASVRVNGQDAGHIDAPPWQTEVTRWIKRGANEVEVTVIGTLKNTLGPHHGGPAPGAAWPWTFQKAPEFGPPPGSQYSTVAYGLFAPFVVKQTTAAEAATAQR